MMVHPSSACTSTAADESRDPPRLMAMDPRGDGRLAVAYDVLVPLDDCPPNGCTGRTRLTNGRMYQDFANATWSCDLPPGWERYRAWLEHEREAKRRMFAFLHNRCPETRELEQWSALWAYTRPELAEGLPTVHFTISPPGEPPDHPAPPAGTAP